MINDGNKIPFVEIKSYEEAYYYNSDPSERMVHDKKDVKVEKKKSDFSGKLLGVLGTIAEGVLEIIFSFLD